MRPFFAPTIHHLSSIIFLSYLRENERRKKEEAELETPWDDIGSAFTEVHNMPVGSEDDDVDLDSMVV